MSYVALQKRFRRETFLVSLRGPSPSVRLRESEHDEQFSNISRKSWTSYTFDFTSCQYVLIRAWVFFYATIRKKSIRNNIRQWKSIENETNTTDDGVMFGLGEKYFFPKNPIVSGCEFFDSVLCTTVLVQPHARTRPACSVWTRSDLWRILIKNSHLERSFALMKTR